VVIDAGFGWGERNLLTYSTPFPPTMSLSISDGGVYQILTGSFPGGSICTTDVTGLINLTTAPLHDEEKVSLGRYARVGGINTGYCC
jgi:hypothetical protein